MTETIQRLAGMAERFVPAENIQTYEAGFAINIDGTDINFFSPGEGAYAGYCRACIAELGEKTFPDGFAEEALNGNFFWRGTSGAVVSYEPDGNAVYLTDRFDEGAFADEDALRDFIEGFMRTLGDWRTRLGLYLDNSAEAKEVL